MVATTDLLFDAVNASVFSYNRHRRHSALNATPDACVHALNNA